MMGADEHGLRSELAQFGEQLLAILHVSEIRFVVTEITPDGPQRPFGLTGVHVHRDGKRSRYRLGGWNIGRADHRVAQRQCQTRKKAATRRIYWERHEWRLAD